MTCAFLARRSTGLTGMSRFLVRAGTMWRTSERPFPLRSSCAAWRLWSRRARCAERRVGGFDGVRPVYEDHQHLGILSTSSLGLDVNKINLVHESKDVRAQVRHIGVSNETSWGVTRFCQLAEQLGLPKIVSIQNSYSLLARALHLLPPSGHSARRAPVCFCLPLLGTLVTAGHAPERQPL